MIYEVRNAQNVTARIRNIRCSSESFKEQVQNANRCREMSGNNEHYTVVRVETVFTTSTIEDAING